MTSENRLHGWTLTILDAYCLERNGCYNYGVLWWGVVPKMCMYSGLILISQLWLSWQVSNLVTFRLTGSGSVGWVMLNTNIIAQVRFSATWAYVKLETFTYKLSCCRQASSHYPNQCWPRSTCTTPYGDTRPQWVKTGPWQDGWEWWRDDEPNQTPAPAIANGNAWSVLIKLTKGISANLAYLGFCENQKTVDRRLDSPQPKWQWNFMAIGKLCIGLPLLLYIHVAWYIWLGMKS